MLPFPRVSVPVWLRRALQALAVLGGILLIYIGLTGGLAAWERLALIVIGGLTAIVDGYFLVRVA